MKGEPIRPKGFIGSVNCAIEGILWAAKTQRHMLFHLVAAILVLIGALALDISLHEFALLALAIILVLFAELVNTAIELIIDLVAPDFHPLAQRAKDVAAGAVLFASGGALILGYLALSRHFFALEAEGSHYNGDHEAHNPHAPNYGMADGKHNFYLRKPNHRSGKRCPVEKSSAGLFLKIPESAHTPGSAESNGCHRPHA